MANLNLKIQQCWTCQVGAATSYSSVSVPIINSGKTNSGAYPSYTSKLSFTTPPFLNKNEKITITVTAKAETHNSKEVTMALSASNYTKIDSVVSPVGYNYNWMASELKSTVISQTLRGNNGAFVLSNISLLPNTTYYLYFLRVGATPVGSNGGYTARYEGKDPQISISLADLAKPPAPIIITETQILPYQGELTLNWNAVNSPNNPLKGYRVFLWRNNSTNPEVAADTTANSYKFSLKSFNRGDSITIGVCAVSSYEAYKNSYADYLKNCNSDTSTIEAGVINILPVINSVTTKGNNSTIGGSTGVTFLINAEDGNSSQSSNLSYYYTLNNNTKKSLGNNNSLTLTLDGLRSEGITETGTYTVTFYAFDGIEYSTAKTATFYAEFAPIISTRGENPIYIADGKGNSSTYIRLITLNFTLKNDVTSGLTAVVKIKTDKKEEGEVLSENYYTLDISKPQKTISIDITKIPTNILSYKSSFSFSYEIKNQANLSSGYDDWRSSTYYRPSKLKEMPAITITNDAREEDDKWQYNFKQSLTFKLTAPPAEEGRPDIKVINLEVTSGGGSNTYELGKDEGALCNKIINLTDCVLVNQTAKIKIQIEDVAGQVTEKEIPQLYTRITTPSFSEAGKKDILPKKLNPHTFADSLSITHIAATNTSNSSIAITYSYKCKISEKFFPFDVSENGSDNDTIRVIANNVADFNGKILNIVGNTSNFSGKASIEVTATDIFDQTTSTSIEFTINTSTAPTFSQDKFDLQHDYDIGSGSSIADVTDNNLNVQIFNPGEGIIFKIPEPVDPNKDVSKFNIYLHRGKLPLDKKNIPAYDDVDYGNTPWLVISKDGLERVEEETEGEKKVFYIYRHAASAYQKNEYFYFKITATDERGNESSKYSEDDPKVQKNGYDAVYSETYIIGARVAPAQIEVEPVETEIDGTNVTIKFKLTENDFGGSATTDDNGNIVWDSEYYNNYPNLARVIASNEIEEGKFINWKKKILIEISPTSDFSGIVFSKEEDYNANAEGYIFKNYPKNSIKVYVRITLKVPYTLEIGNQKYISSISAVYSYFGEAPTIAYRPHKVGINVKAIDDEAVLVIQSYKNYKKIIIGPDEDHKITIDIENQTIDGITINCGGW